MNNKIVIIGSGGHAKVIIDIVRSMKKYEIVGTTSSDKSKPILNIPILGGDEVLEPLHRRGILNAFVAIGDNRIRNNVSKYAIKVGYSLINAISPFSYISSTVKLGFGIAIMPGAIINIDTVISNNVIINTGATVDHDNVIGESVHIAPGCHLAGNVHVGSGTFLGVGTKVIPNIKIGSWSMLGAGSVIVKNIPNNISAYGVPARVIKTN